MHRLFVAIRPPEAIRDRLLDRMDDSLDVRWQSDEQLHLTLRFVGEVERPMAEDLAAALQRVSAPVFDLRLAGIGSFDRRNGGVLWAGVEPREPVAALAARIERACQTVGVAPERRAFHPHITLARWSGRRPPALGNWLQQHGLSSHAFVVDRFTLFESRLSRHGAHYEPVADFALE